MSTNLDFTEHNEYSYHKPVMLEECMDSLAVKQGGLYIDCTLGGGGHTKGKLGILFN
jgi:16S rRNA (cytosine1402-N4)-methyltransferase